MEPNSLQTGSVLNAIQHLGNWLFGFELPAARHFNAGSYDLPNRTIFKVRISDLHFALELLANAKRDNALTILNVIETASYEHVQISMN